MSSILRALKKLEKEMPGDTSAPPADAVRIDIRSTVRKRLWRGCLLQKLSLAASVLILVFLMFWITWNKSAVFPRADQNAPLSGPKVSDIHRPAGTVSKDDRLSASLPKTEGEISAAAEADIKKPSERAASPAPGDKKVLKKTIAAGSASSSQTSSKTEQSPSAAPPSSAVPPFIEPANTSSPDVSDGLTDVDLLLDIVEIPEIEEKPKKKKTAAAAASAETAVKRSLKAPSAAVSKPMPKAKTAPKTKTEKVQRKKTPEPEVTSPGTGEKSPVYTPSQKELAYQQVPERAETETGLEIQALVWSPVLEERFTVVNGDILKIGAFLDDVSVQYIGENFVILQKKGTRWQQKMQVR